MSGRTIGYVRVSTEEQNLDRQLAAMGEVDYLFSDKMSGKNIQRKGLQEMLEFASAGDTIRVKSVDRLARSTKDLLQLLDDLSSRKINVEFLDTPYMNTNSKEGRFFLTILGALAEMERTTIRERQAEGIAIAKAAGKYEQQPKLSEDDIELARTLIDKGESKASVARQLGVARITLYSALNGTGAYAKVPRSFECENCGTHVEVTERTDKRQKYCCKKCEEEAKKQKAYRQNSKEERDRKIILRYLEGMTCETIAANYKITVSEVEGIIHDARIKLRTEEAF